MLLNLLRFWTFDAASRSTHDAQMYEMQNQLSSVQAQMDTMLAMLQNLNYRQPTAAAPPTFVQKPAAAPAAPTSKTPSPLGTHHIEIRNFEDGTSNV